MILRNYDIFISREPLNTIVNLDFPVLISYNLSKMICKLNEQLKIIDDTRNVLIKKYGAVDSDGKISIAPNSESYFKFVNDFNILMNVEIDINIDKITIPEKIFLECNATTNVKPSVFIGLEKLIEIDNEK